MIPVSLLSALIGLFSKATDRLLPPDKKESRAQQVALNEAELAKAPPSFLLLWRPLLGTVLTLLFVWEVVGRMVLIPIFFPELVETLPPPVLKEIISLLLGMLGLGF